MHRLLLRLFTLLPLAGLVELAACGKGGTPPTLTQIYQYPDDTFIENLLSLPSGEILLSTFASGDLVSIDPRAPTPTPRTLARLGDDATGLTAIVRLPFNQYAVAGGTYMPFGFVNNTMALHVVKLGTAASAGAVVASIPVPGTTMMNGLAALPHRPFTLLSADSVEGRLLRIDTLTRRVDVAWADPAFATGGTPETRLGINGIKIVGDWLYFTNSGQGTFSQVRIDRDGNRAGNVQVIARLPAPANVTYAFDDFDFDRCGNAYVAMHSSWIVKISPGGELTTVAGGGQGPANAPAIKAPTSVSTAADGKSVYISTGGDFLAPPVTGGQLLRLDLPRDC